MLFSSLSLSPAKTFASLSPSLPASSAALKRCGRRALFLLCLAGGSPVLLPAQETPVDFNDHVRPIFNQHCVACHGGVKKASGISFLSREETMSPGKSGRPPVVPGNSASSPLLERVTSTDEDERMPPPEHGPPLDEKDVQILSAWIDQGAPWEAHWAFTPLRRPSVPQPNPDSGETAASLSPIDHFIRDRLQAEGLHPAPRADKATLLRRLSFDLVGLPPTPAQLDAFLADPRPEAYAEVVEELLHSPAFGERWAAMWLDLARYADSEGLGVDSRRETWAYRDWLIRAFNENKPYDQFVIEQLAGDLLPHPSTDQLIATAFHRQTQSNGEGGTDDEEFRVAAVIDRTNTTWEVFQGVTFGCVQCHSHPYDPIQHEEYYAFMAFFNNSADADLGDHWPTLRVPLDATHAPREAELRHRLHALRQEKTSDVLREVEATAWHHVPASQVETASEGNGVRMVSGPEGPEFRAVGNIAAGTEYVFTFPAPEAWAGVTAIRLDMMPVDDVQARHTPEWSGILSHLQIDRLQPGETQWEAIPLREVLGDEPDPVFDPNESLKKGGGGFGAMSKIFHRRTAVIVPLEPITVRPGTRLRLTMKHDLQALGAFPLVTQRGAFALTDDARWTIPGLGEKWSARDREIADLQREYDRFPAASVPIMRERPTRLARESRLFERGNWLEKGRVMTPDVPAFFPSLPADRPRDRLTLARWLVSDENPLTARVAVNRFWEQLFGYGLVVTLEDLGSAGSKPTHPELLDWLAVQFQRDWNIKAFLRTLVLSATYQQDAGTTPALHERDPQNLLLARGPRRRLKAEMVRDFALAAGGLLSSTQFGPPVRPPLPEGVWKPFANDPWETAEDADRYRRALYVYWKRSIPFPSLVTFDAPSRELCQQRRLPSNTPLQALVTLNDPVFVEAAASLADRMRGFSPRLEDQLRHGYRWCTSHEPDAARLQELVRLHAELSQSARTSLPPDGPSPDEAAMQSVASVLLNLDASLTK